MDKSEEMIVRSKAYMPRRPEYGTSGRKITLKTNFFEVTQLPSRDIYQYDVQIDPLVEMKSIAKIVVDAMYDDNKKMFDNTLPAFDGEKNIYFPKKLPFTEQTFELTIQMKKGEEKFKVKLKEAACINMDVLKKFLQGNSGFELPQNQIQALNVMLKTTPLRNYTSIGSSFFTGKNVLPLNVGAEIWLGYHQSLRPSSKRVLVNIDVAATVMIKSQPCLDIVVETLNMRDPSMLSKVNIKNNMSDYKAIKEAMVGLKFEVLHRPVKRTYRVKNIVKKTPAEMFFDFSRDDGNSVSMSVLDYFNKELKKPIKYPNLPLVETGASKKIYFPIEYCKVKGGDRMVRKLTGNETTLMIRATATKPQKRVDTIMRSVKERNFRQDGVLAKFGAQIKEEMVTTTGRVLSPPSVAYAHNKALVPKGGVWKSDGSQFHSPKNLNNWVVLCLDGDRFCSKDKVIKFIQTFEKTGTAHGMKINKNPPIVYPKMRRGEGYRNAIVQALKQGGKGKIDLLMIILPGKDPKAYAQVKCICETDLDVVTQCVKPINVIKANFNTATNILYKVNVKLGGINNIVSKSPFQALPLSEPIIIFGADVTHTTQFSTAPSIAAVVGSMNAYASSFATEIRTQGSRIEIIQDLKGCIKNLLIKFRRVTNQIPQKLVFYRDGVSEGQFREVLANELTQMREACLELDSSYQPAITYIIVQKRHHARLFITNPKDGDRSGNVPAGTVVDGDITTATNHDFYLCSHAGIQGTSRPTHYQVIWDEIGLGANFLQDLTNSMCYLYPRCTRSVSIVPPVYYAHLACFRARHHSVGDINADLKSQSTIKRSDFWIYIPIEVVNITIAVMNIMPIIII